MLQGVVKVQPLAGLRKAIIGQTPDPHGPVGNNQRAGRLAQPSPQGLGVELFAQRVDALTGGDETAFGDDGPSASRLAAMIQPEAGAGIDPVPAFGLLTRAAQGGTLAPVVALANVPGVHLNDHLVRLQRQFELLLCGGGLLIQFGAQTLGAFALSPGFAIQRGAASRSRFWPSWAA